MDDRERILRFFAREPRVRRQVKKANLGILLEGLMPAFEHLKSIRTLHSQKIPELNRKLIYEDFTRVLWHAHKDLMQRAAKLMAPEIGCVFQKDSQFEAALRAMRTKRPMETRKKAAMKPTTPSPSA